MSLGGLGVLLIVGYVVCGVWYVGGPGISLTELAQAIDGKLRVFFPLDWSENCQANATCLKWWLLARLLLLAA